MTFLSLAVLCCFALAILLPNKINTPDRLAEELVSALEKRSTEEIIRLVSPEYDGESEMMALLALRLDHPEVIEIRQNPEADYLATAFISTNGLELLAVDLRRYEQWGWKMVVGCRKPSASRLATVKEHCNLVKVVSR